MSRNIFGVEANNPFLLVGGCKGRGKKMGLKKKGWRVEKNFNFSYFCFVGSKKVKK